MSLKERTRMGNTSTIKSVSGIYFSWAGKLSFGGQCLLWIAAFIEVIGMVWPTSTINWKYWNQVLILEALLLVAYSLLTLGSSIANFLARKKKINDVVDNAFGTEIGIEHSENYFDNEEIKEGTKKLLYNTAESCFFSYRELKSMVGGVCLRTFIPFAILIIGLFVNKTEVIMAIFRISAIFVLLIQAIQFFVTLFQLEVLLSRMLDTLKHKIGSAGQFNAESINYALEYEAVMVWYGVKIPDKVYFKLNERLTSEWNNLKTTFLVN